MSGPAAPGGARRALRVLLVANDGFSAGHVARTVAVARGLARRAAHRSIELRTLVATTSEAHALLAAEPIAVVHLPAPLAARRAGFSDAERRRVVRATLDGISESYGPDLIVADTFPSGPHGELGGIGVGRAKRALVRRHVPDERMGDETLVAGLGDYDLAVVADDPLPFDSRLPIPSARVPPITIGEALDARSRETSRAALGLPIDGRVILVAAGGGGDAEAVDRARSIAEAVARVAPDVIVALAQGPLDPARGGGSLRGDANVRIVTAIPLQPLLAAFDGAFAPAGYNTAHELAKGGVPAALFAQPRPFDDQAARATRFERASLARALARLDDDAIAAALAWMQTAPRPAVEGGGADRAADLLLDLATGKAGAR